MDVHKNARLTAHCRGLLVERVLKGQSQQDVARQLGVSVPTVRKWMKRYRAEGIAGAYSVDDDRRFRSNVTADSGHVGAV